MSTHCVACQRELASQKERVTTLCTGCAEEHGVVPMPPARRPKAPCTKCHGWQFLRIIPRELTATGADYVDEVAAPMGLTYLPQAHKGWLVTSPLPVDARKSFGHVETYVCKRCGFVEWYCVDVERVPVGPAYMTEEVDYEAREAPYR